MQEIKDEDAGVPDDGWLNLSVQKPGWRRTSHTCNDEHQVENKMKFIAAGGLRGVSFLIFDARGSRLDNELCRRDCVTVESHKSIQSPNVNDGAHRTEIIIRAARRREVYGERAQQFVSSRLFRTRHLASQSTASSTSPWSRTVQVVMAQAESQRHR